MYIKIYYSTSKNNHQVFETNNFSQINQIQWIFSTVQDNFDGRPQKYLKNKQILMDSRMKQNQN